MSVILLLSTFLVPISIAVTDHNYPVSRTPIKHVIEIMMENHSFDNFFGTYPSNNLSLKVNHPLNLNNLTNSSFIERLPAGTFSTPDPVEGYTAYHLDWNHGKMNGFLNGSGRQSLTTFTADQMAPEWDLAMEFAIDDMDFSMLTETTPNRLYSLAGYSPVMNDYGPPPCIPYDETIMSELDSYNLSWGYFVQNVSDGYAPVNFISGINAHSSNIQDWSSFISDLRTGNLPNVSWVMPVGGGASDLYSQGPPNNVLFGEMWIMYLVNAVMKSRYWNSTAIFITYDEGGGYYDQVAPPVVNGIQLGLRIPFIAISPYAKENYVSSTILDQSSVLAFIDYNWNMPALNSFVSLSGIPVDMFDFSQTYKNGILIRQPISLSAYGLPVPDSYVFPFNSSKYFNLSDLFPIPLEYPLSDLPYAEYGSSNLTISSYSSALYVTQDHPFTVFYLSDTMIWALLIASLLIAYFLPKISKRTAKHERR